MNSTAATLHVVATPIGNLEDISLRAISVLRSVDLILCEDTRTTKTLLARHEIATRTMSYHAHSALSRTDEIIALLREGKNLALVSDAGTPGISDPGAELVSRLRAELVAEIDAGRIRIESVPGPSALIAALSIAGVPCADFTFLGFLPHKKGRETLFREIAAAERTMVFYESPHRILKTLESLAEHLNAHADSAAGSSEGEAKLSPKRVTVCRELTKVFEQVISGSAAEVNEYFKNHADKVRGEFVCIVSQK